MKYFLIASISLLLCFNEAQAAAVKTTDPKAYSTSVSTAIVDVIKSDLSEEEKFKKLTSVFIDNVDTDFMGKFAMGRYFRTAKPDMQKKYLTLYRDYVMYSYVPKFKNYANQTVEILAANKAKNDEYIVKSRLKPKGGEVKEILLDYRIKKNGSSFKIVDIIGEGVSYITNQRSDFGSALSQMPLVEYNLYT